MSQTGAKKAQEEKIETKIIDDETRPSPFDSRPREKEVPHYGSYVNRWGAPIK